MPLSFQSWMIWSSQCCSPATPKSGNAMDPSLLESNSNLLCPVWGCCCCSCLWSRPWSSGGEELLLLVVEDAELLLDSQPASTSLMQVTGSTDLEHKHSNIFEKYFAVIHEKLNKVVASSILFFQKMAVRSICSATRCSTGCAIFRGTSYREVLWAIWKSFEISPDGAKV